MVLSRPVEFLETPEDFFFFFKIGGVETCLCLAEVLLWTLCGGGLSAICYPTQCF